MADVRSQCRVSITWKMMCPLGIASGNGIVMPCFVMLWSLTSCWTLACFLVWTRLNVNLNNRQRCSDGAWNPMLGVTFDVSSCHSVGAQLWFIRWHQELPEGWYLLLISASSSWLRLICRLLHLASYSGFRSLPLMLSDLHSIEFCIQELCCIVLRCSPTQLPVVSWTPACFLRSIMISFSILAFGSCGQSSLQWHVCALLDG